MLNRICKGCRAYRHPLLHEPGWQQQDCPRLCQESWTVLTVAESNCGDAQRFLCSLSFCHRNPPAWGVDPCGSFAGEIYLVNPHQESIGGPSMLSGHRRAASGADSYAHSRTWIHCTSSQKSVCVRKGGHELGCDSQCTEGKM